MGSENGSRNGSKPKSAKPGTLRNDDGVVVCGSAKANGGGLCQSVAVMPNGRCRSHGGKSLPPGPGHPTFVHGRRSKVVEALPPRLRDGFEASVRDPDLVSVRTELALVDTRVIALLDEISGDGVDALVSKLDELSSFSGPGGDVPDSTESSEDEVRKLVAEARALVQTLRNESATWREIRATIETRRRLSDSERRLLEHKQAVVEISELRAIMAFLLQSVKDHVLSLDGGRDAVAGIALDVQRLGLLGGGPTPEKAIEA